MPDILVRSLSEQTIGALKRRAERHKRSLQQEVHSILEESAEEYEATDAVQIAEAIRANLARRGRAFVDSARLIREDRER